MSNNRLNCCKKEENVCAYMFLHQRVLGENPVNAFPSINVWGTKFLGYTGPAAPGYTGPNGFTICGISFGNRGYGNEGIPAEYELWDTSKLLVNLPGHYIKWDGSPDGTETNFSYHIGGTLILPTKYRGITLNNSEKDGEDLYYKYFGGYEYHYELFDPITGEPTDEYDPTTGELLLSSYRRHSTTEDIWNCYGRYSAELPPAIVTYLTGDKCDATLEYKTKDLKQIITREDIDSKHTFYIKVEYSDVLSEYISNSRSNIFYSVVLSSGLQEGNAPLSLIHLLGSYKDFMCGIDDCGVGYPVNIPPITNGPEISNAAWSSIPESIHLVSINIQFCGESENNTKDVINLVPTRIDEIAEIQLAVPTTSVEEIDGRCPDSSLGCPTLPDHLLYSLLKTDFHIPIQLKPEIHSMAGLGFGMSWDDEGICRRYTFVFTNCDDSEYCPHPQGEFCCPGIGRTDYDRTKELLTTQINTRWDYYVHAAYPAANCYTHTTGQSQVWMEGHVNCGQVNSTPVQPDQLHPDYPTPSGFIEKTYLCHTETFTQPHCCDVGYPGFWVNSRWGGKTEKYSSTNQFVGCACHLPGSSCPINVYTPPDEDVTNDFGIKEGWRGSCQSGGTEPNYGDCCECQIGNCGTPDSQNLVIDVLQEKTTTSYKINPYLMIDKHGAYFIGVGGGDEIPDFGKYIKYMSSTIWKSDRRSNDADIDKYTLVSRNNSSKCSNYFINYRPPGEYYMWNKEADTRIAAWESVCGIYRFKNKGPNPWPVDSRSYKFLKSSLPRCTKVRPYPKTDLVGRAYEEPDPIQAPKCWKKLKHKYPLVLTFDSDGITHYALTGITIDACLDLPSIQFVKDQAVDYTFPQPTIYP